jgi:hypothetical protein
MSIGEFSTSEAALSEQPAETSTKKTPPKRKVIAQADQVTQPEPR